MAYSPYAEHSLAVLRSNGSFTTLAQMPGLLYCVKSDLILCFPGWSQGVFCSSLHRLMVRVAYLGLEQSLADPRDNGFHENELQSL